MKMLHFIHAVLLLATYITGSSTKSAGTMKSCSFSSDCSPSECCVMSRDKPYARICAKKPDLGKVCSPALLPGLDYSCPCAQGLTCAKISQEEESYACVPVPEIEEELEQMHDKL